MPRLRNTLTIHSEWGGLASQRRSGVSSFFGTDIQLCAHEFRELIHSPFELPVPVRLALLADINDLALHPDFDTGRFLDLARLWGDSTARVMGHFFQTVFGSNPLPCPTFPTSVVPLPRQIGVRGVWTSLGTSRQWLIGPERIEILQRL